MSDELKERPIDFETERPSQLEIDAAVAKDARIKELEDDRGNWKELASQINTDWIPANKQMSDRIAGLEYVMQEAREVIERQRDERLKLEAENQRLRDGIANAMLCDSVVQMHECLAALLGGGE